MEVSCPDCRGGVDNRGKKAKTVQPQEGSVEADSFIGAREEARGRRNIAGDRRVAGVRACPPAWRHTRVAGDQRKASRFVHCPVLWSKGSGRWRRFIALACGRGAVRTRPGAAADTWKGFLVGGRGVGEAPICRILRLICVGSGPELIPDQVEFEEVGVEAADGIPHCVAGADG